MSAFTLPQKGQFAGLGGFNQELVPVLPERKSEEIEVVRDVSDVCFFAVQLTPARTWGQWETSGTRCSATSRVGQMMMKSSA